MKKFTISEVKLTDGFYKNRQLINENATLDNVYKRFEETGRFASLACTEGIESHIFWDSDVYKWMEGVAYYLADNENESLKTVFDNTVDTIVKNQRKDGYFNSHYIMKKLTTFENRGHHELYCAGHMFEAAVAASMYLKDDRLLRVSERYVDHIIKRFVTDKDTAFVTPGHQEIELALYRLYEHTGKEKYKMLADFFINERGVAPDPDRGTNYNQTHLPVREQREALGHCVRALYMYSAMADLARLDNDEKMLEALEALTLDIVNNKMYITGGIGSTRAGERFSCEYDLPNATAYTETCASIAMVFYCDRMYRVTGKKLYADIIERELYNGVLAGVSLDGLSYFYENPLEMNLAHFKFNNGYTGSPEKTAIPKRVKVFSCSCCPPNICRFFELIGEYIYYGEENSLTVSQYISSKLSGDIACEMVSDMPNSGKVTLKVDSKGKNITVKLRVPEWCAEKFDNEQDGYLVFSGVFDNSEISVDFKPTVVKNYSNPKVYANEGKAALSYGPLVLCAEACDNEFHLSGVKLCDVSSAEVIAASDASYAINVTVPVKVPKVTDALYTSSAPEYEEKNMKMIPYFAWANREDGDMKVWFID